MKLMEKTSQARHLTRQLNRALDGQDLEMWLELLDQRERAMAAFDAAHQAALDPEREACRDEIAALQGEDRQLQLRSENLLEQLAGEFREQLGSSSFGGNRKERDSQLACLDRKA